MPASPPTADPEAPGPSLDPGPAAGLESTLEATPAALAMIARLRAMHGPLMFHQSGGCCDGSSPMCYPAGEFRVGVRDVKLGELGGCPYYIGGAQYELWKHTRLTLDVVPGRGAGFSLEAPEGVRFLIRSDLCRA
jgi:uncharacterized protein (DUF779 family)